MIKLKPTEYFCYDESNFRLGKNSLDRIDVSWIGRGMTKTLFMKILDKSRFVEGSFNWIRERIEISENKKYANICNDNYGKIICIVSGYPFGHPMDKILKIIDMKSDPS